MKRVDVGARGLSPHPRRASAHGSSWSATVPIRADVERQAPEHGLGDDVVFLGEQDDLVALLSVSDLFLLPSIQESFGLAALEAMACGVPVVASKVGGLPEIIEDGVTGFVCAPDDVEGMAERGVALLTDPDLHAPHRGQRRQPGRARRIAPTASSRSMKRPIVECWRS